MTMSPEEEVPFVVVQLERAHPTMPEVIEALSALDRAWAVAARFAAIDEVLAAADEQAVGQRGAKREPQGVIDPDEIADLRHSLADLSSVARPQVRLSMQSPLIVDLSGWVAGFSTVAGSISVWQAFKYLVANAEQVGGLPHRLRFGWHTARIEAENARAQATAARRRRQLQELELAGSELIEDLGRDLRRLGPAGVMSNLPESPDVLG